MNDMEGDAKRIKHFGQEAYLHLGSDTEGKVTAQQSSKLSEHFANICSIPSNVGTEMKIQKAEPRKKYRRSKGDLFISPLSSACFIFLPVHLNPLKKKHNITTGRT